MSVSALRFTPGEPLDPVAVMLPGLPFWVRMIVGYILICLGIYHPMRKALRRQRDSLQIYTLSMTLDVDALTQAAKHYTVIDLIASCAARPKPNITARQLGSVSPAIEIRRVSPACPQSKFKMACSISAPNLTPSLTVKSCDKLPKLPATWRFAAKGGFVNRAKGLFVWPDLNVLMPRRAVPP